MKKIMAIGAMAAMVAGAAFAEVNVGMWGRTGLDFTVGLNNDQASTVVAIPSWAGSTTSTGGSRVGVNFGASNEEGNIGFNLNLDSNAGTPGIGDQAKIWGKLFNNMVTVQFGKIQLDTLRGSVGSYGDREAMAWVGEDDCFSRFNPSLGTTVSFDSNGIFVGAALDTSSTTNAPDVFKAVQAGAGYTIDGIAQIKAQYIGSSKVVNVGVDLLMVPGSTVELGSKIGVSGTTDVSVVLAAQGGYGDLSYNAHVKEAYNGSNTITADGAVEYNLGIVTAGANAGMQYSTAATYGFGAYAKKGFSNGYLFGGVQYNGTGSSVGTLHFPVEIECWF